MPKYRLTKDCTLPLEMVGLHQTLMPLLQFTSSQRAMMFSAHVSQHVDIVGAKPPKIAAGTELLIGDYDINDAGVDKDIRILAVIPKFKTNLGSRQITENPMWTVIYADDRAKTIGVFHVKKYTDLDSGFGYPNVLVNRALLKPDTPVDAGTRFTRAPCHTDTGYNMGVDLNVIFATEFGATEDAIIINKRASNLLNHWSIKNTEISITEKDLPLNLYGNETEFKAFPDIGEQVGRDCLLIGFREYNPLTMLGEMTNDALQSPNYMYDKLHYTTNSEAQVIDVQVSVNPRIIRNLRKEDNVYNQFVKYQDQHLQYYRAILNEYRIHVLKNKYRCEDAFNTLVTRSMGFLEPFEKPNSKLRPSYFKEDIDFIHVKLSYAYLTEMSLGRKLTGRDGAKGVISAIWEDEDMPTDEFGRRADMIISPESGFNRMNPTQFYEQCLNRLSDKVAEDMVNMSDSDAYNYLMGYLHDVRPAYQEYVESKVPTPELKTRLVEDTRKHGMVLVLTPFCDAINTKKMLDLVEKYKLTKTPVTYYRRDGKTGQRRKIVTQQPMLIGEKYIFNLGKLPEDQISAVSSGYVNQYSTPTKPNKVGLKASHPIGRTPIRIGEDEKCLMIMSLGPDTVERIVGINSNSVEALNVQNYELLTNPHPTKLRSITLTTKEIIASSTTASIFDHMLGVIGYEWATQQERRRA